MAYVKTNWEDYPSTTTAIDADALNHMEEGIYNNDQALGGKLDNASPSFSGNMTGSGNVTVGGEVENGNGETLHGAYQSAENVLPIDTASGNPTVITDAFGGLAKSLKLTLNPIQSGSGTPSPSNVRPISGRNSAIVRVCGKNMQKIADCINGATIDSDGSIGTSSNFKVYYVKVLKGITYTITTQDNTAVVYAFYNSQPTSGAASYDNARILDYNSLEHSTFVAPITGFLAYRAVNAFTKPQVEASSSATSYSDFSHLTDYTIQLGQTVYGGVLDVTTGILTIDKSLVIYDGSQDENWGGSQLTTVYRAGIGLSNAVNDNGASNYLPYINNWSSDTEHFYIYNNAVYAFIAVQGLARFKEYLAEHNLQIWYKLATPTTVQLTAEDVDLLKGNNVLTTDADLIEASYSADIALYIAKKIAEGSNNRSVNNSSLTKGGSSNEEVKEEEIEIKEEEPLTKEVR
jgi:hypothetical protein